MIAIGEAIETLSESAFHGSTTLDQHFIEAEKLGIEALQLVKELQSLPGRRSSFWLPGQTED